MFTLPDVMRSCHFLACGACAVALVGASACSDARVPVWTDGDFGDWAGIAPVVVDPMGDAGPGSPVDLRTVAAQDDPRFLHVLIDLGATVTAQGMLGSVEVVLDADGDRATGGAYGGVEGADLAIVLSREVAADSDVHGAGVGIRRVGSDGPGQVEGSASAGLLVAPTHSSDRFELRVERGAVGAMGRVVVGRVRYLSGGDIVDETPIFTHVLVTEPGGDPPLLGADELARAPGTHRVVVWNVSSRSFRANRRAFQRVLAGLAPDVVLLDEVYADVTMEELAGFGEGVPVGEAAPDAWSWWLASGGGRQRTVVGARGLEVRGARGLSRIDHAPGALEGWLGEVGDDPESPGMAPPAELAMAEEEGGLSATGAWVSLDGRDVLFVPVDLQSAGYDGSPRDRLRELQARTLNRAVAAALAERPGAGLVIGGDLNVVGSARPLDELRRGLGIDGGDLVVARLERRRDRSLSTWRGTWGDDPFSPGRLDFVLYRGAVLRAQRAFVFDAADLTADALRDLGLRDSDTEHSDHLPLVVDFRVR
ncbi:MAG: endonuclease/exonuclease/phosphatase family protein [Gemmatimonadota bacterium]|nr:endonuclease/exonuclease/phosphatase family protein [Gemmatimonadota bacterium]